MKKILYLLLLFVASGFNTSWAAEPAGETVDAEGVSVLMKENKTHMEQVAEAIKKRPKACGVASVDNFADQVFAAGAAFQQTAETLENLYTRQVSTNEETGVTSVETTKPKLEDWMNLLAKLTTQTTELAGMTATAAALPTALTQIKNPLQIGKAKKVIGSTGDLFKLIGTGTKDQVKAVNSIISILKSNGNL